MNEPLFCYLFWILLRDVFAEYLIINSGAVYVFHLNVLSEFSTFCQHAHVRAIWQVFWSPVH